MWVLVWVLVQVVVLALGLVFLSMCCSRLALELDLLLWVGQLVELMALVWAPLSEGVLELV